MPVTRWNDAAEEYTAADNGDIRMSSYTNGCKNNFTSCPGYKKGPEKNSGPFPKNKSKYWI
jgi:hypothetical protein